MKSDLSLFAVFIVKWWKKLFKCVSPPLVGAVLLLSVFLCTPIVSHAGSFSVGVTLYENMGNVSLGSENGVVEYTPFGYVFSNQAGRSASNLDVGGVITFTDFKATLSSSISAYFKNEFCLLLNYDGSLYEIYPLYEDDSVYYFPDITLPINRLISLSGVVDGQIFSISFRAYNNSLISSNKKGTITVDYSFTYSADGGTGNINNDPVVDELQKQIAQDKSYHNQDQNDATMAGQDMSGFASQLDNLKNTWAILWYPIEFTNKFVQVFTGGTQTAAFDDYDYVSGYRYNNDTGMLEPMMSRSIQSRTAGTGITFPSIELMGYTVWEPYTYDLSTLKDQFPVIFDALYVFISMLEVFWFVGFLRSKYNEVFG